MLDRDDDLLVIAGLPRGVALQQAQGLEALGAWEAEVIVVVAAHAGLDGAQADEAHEPAGEDDATVPKAPAGKACQWMVGLRWGVRVRRNLAPQGQDRGSRGLWAGRGRRGGRRRARARRGARRGEPPQSTVERNVPAAMRVLQNAADGSTRRDLVPCTPPGAFQERRRVRPRRGGLADVRERRTGGTFARAVAGIVRRVWAVRDQIVGRWRRGLGFRSKISNSCR